MWPCSPGQEVWAWYGCVRKGLTEHPAARYNATATTAAPWTGTPPLLLYVPQMFNIAAFVPKVRLYLDVAQPHKRRFLISWISVRMVRGGGGGRAVLIGGLRCVWVQGVFCVLLRAPQSFGVTAATLPLHLRACGAPQDRIKKLPPRVPPCEQVLDSMPDIDIIGYLPMLLDGLMGMLSDPNKDIQQAASKVINVRHFALGIPKQCA